MNPAALAVLVFAVSGSGAESEKKLQQAGAGYGMTIDVAAQGTKVDTGVTCTAMSSTHKTIALPVLLPELQRYPKDFFTGAGIQRMVLCGALSRGGQKWGGLAYDGGTFYLNLENANRNSAHAARTLHHEIFHLVDQVDEVEWSKISGGFISDYAKTAPREDRAELYSEMMVNRKAVSAKGASNAGLAQKTRILEKFIEASLPGVKLK